MAPPSADRRLRRTRIFSQNCGKEFIDKYAVEIAVSGIKETSTKKTEPIYYFSLLIGVVFMLIGIVYPRGDINVTLITGIMIFSTLKHSWKTWNTKEPPKILPL